MGDVEIHDAMMCSRAAWEIPEVIVTSPEGKF